MIWTRKELKERGLAAFKSNYWKCVIVALILVFITQAATGGNGSNGKSIIKSLTKGSLSLGSFDLSDIQGLDDISGISDISGLSDISGYSELFEESDLSDYSGLSEISDFSDLMASDFSLTDLLGDDRVASFLRKLLIVGLVLVIIVLILGILFKSLLVNPIIVGGCGFFLKNSNDSTVIPKKLLDGFQQNYKGTVLTMFLKDSFVSLWALLFLVPGIVKAYEYRMIPYLLADHPDMDWREAFEESKRLMDGNKWNAFVLDLSFLGWEILSSLSMNLLGIFFVNPYRYATNAELYLTLSQTDIELEVNYNEFFSNDFT